MKNKHVRKYCHAVGQKLICMPETKKRLLRGLEEELINLDGDALNSPRQLAEKVGSPDCVAEELQGCVSAEDFSRAVCMGKRRSRIVVGAAVCLAVLAICGALFYFANSPLYIIETIGE